MMNKKYLLALRLLLAVPLCVNAMDIEEPITFHDSSGDNDSSGQPERLEERRPKRTLLDWILRRNKPEAAGKKPTRANSSTGLKNSTGTRGDQGSRDSGTVVVVRGDGQATDLSLKQREALVKAANKNKRGWAFWRPSTLPKKGAQLTDNQQTLCKKLIQEINKDPNFKLTLDDINGLNRSDLALVRQMLNSAKQASTYAQRIMEKNNMDSVDRTLVDAILLDRVSFESGFGEYKAELQKAITDEKIVMDAVSAILTEVYVKNGQMPTRQQMTDQMADLRNSESSKKTVASVDEKTVNVVVKALFSSEDKTLLNTMLDNSVGVDRAHSVVHNFTLDLVKEWPQSKQKNMGRIFVWRVVPEIFKETPETLRGVLEAERKIYLTKQAFEALAGKVSRTWRDDAKSRDEIASVKYKEGAPGRSLVDLFLNDAGLRVAFIGAVGEEATWISAQRWGSE